MLLMRDYIIGFLVMVFLVTGMSYGMYELAGNYDKTVNSTFSDEFSNLNATFSTLEETVKSMESPFSSGGMKSFVGAEGNIVAALLEVVKFPLTLLKIIPTIISNFYSLIPLPMWFKTFVTLVLTVLLVMVLISLTRGINT